MVCSCWPSDSSRRRTSMSKYIPGNQKHLTLEDRKYIETERAVATLELDKYNVVLSKKTDSSKNVTVTLKDQYGDKWAVADYKLNVECLSTDAKNIAKETIATKNVTGTKYYTYTAGTQNVSFNASAEAGNYVYKISYNKDNKEIAAKTVSVVVKDSDKAASSYRIDIDNSNVDTKIDNDNRSTKTINVKVFGVADNGTDVSTVTGAAFTVKKADGTKIFEGTTGIGTTTHAGISISADQSTLVINPVEVSAGLATKNLEAGIYYVEAKKTIDSKDVDFTASFTITDSQSKAAVEVKNETVAGGTVSAMLDKALVVTFDGTTYTNIPNVADGQKTLTFGTVEAKKNDGTKIIGSDSVTTSGEYFTVTKLTVKVNVATGVDTYMEVSVPGTITAK